MTTTLDRYKSRTAALNLDAIDVDAFRDRPLDRDVLRCLRYMHDVESHTVCYLRDLLVTSAHRDPEITTFLTLWNFEELWHGEAIGMVLDAHGEAAGLPRVSDMRASLPVRDRVAPLASGLASGLAGPSFTAVHMTWGAVNEWTTQAGYARLAAKADHPALSELLRRIMRQEGRHIDFYSSQARRRLEHDRRARRLTRFALRHFWQPVGASVMPADEVGFVIRTLFGDEAGFEAARRLDRCIDRLPGLDGLGLITGAVARHGGNGRS